MPPLRLLNFTFYWWWHPGEPVVESLELAFLNLSRIHENPSIYLFHGWFAWLCTPTSFFAAVWASQSLKHQRIDNLLRKSIGSLPKSFCVLCPPHQRQSCEFPFFLQPISKISGFQKASKGVDPPLMLHLRNCASGPNLNNGTSETREACKHNVHKVVVLCSMSEKAK